MREYLLRENSNQVSRDDPKYPGWWNKNISDVHGGGFIVSSYSKEQQGDQLETVIKHIVH